MTVTYLSPMTRLAGHAKPRISKQFWWSSLSMFTIRTVCGLWPQLGLSNHRNIAIQSNHPIDVVNHNNICLHGYRLHQKTIKMLFCHIVHPLGQRWIKKRSHWVSYGKQIHAHVQADDDGSVHKEKIYMYIYQNFLETLFSSDHMGLDFSWKRPW